MSNLIPCDVLESPNFVIGIGEGSHGVSEYRGIWLQVLNEVITMWKKGGNGKKRSIVHPKSKKKRKIVVLLEEDYWALKDWHGFLRYTTNNDPEISHRSTILFKFFRSYIQRHLFPFLFPHNRTKEFIQFMYECYINNIPVFGVDVHGEQKTTPKQPEMDDFIWKQHRRWKEDPENLHTSCIQECIDFVHNYTKKITFHDRETRTLFFGHNFYVSHEQGFKGWSLATYAKEGTAMSFEEKEEDKNNNNINDVTNVTPFHYPNDTILSIIIPKDSTHLFVLEKCEKPFTFTCHSTNVKWEDTFQTDEFNCVVVFPFVVKATGFLFST